jgi:hypothetical protein
MLGSEPALGDLLQAEIGPDRFELVRRNTLDPRNAAAMALAAYLERVVFVVGAGDDGQPREFQLNEVRREWPESFDGLNYPLATITSAAEPLMAHNFAPTMLEETANVFCPNSVLWKTDELAVEFQIDFWTTNKPEREAIAARLADVFSPTERRAGILIQGPVAYFSQPIRCTLLAGERVDNPASAYNRDREYRARVLADVDVVHLRKVVELNPILVPVEPLEPA